MSLPTILAIEGNIGAGKSTLLRYIREHYPKIVLIDEPVDIWETMKTPDGKNIIQHFYGDMKRWAYTFQNTALLTRIENIQRAVESHPADSLRYGALLSNRPPCLRKDSSRRQKDERHGNGYVFTLVQSFHLQISNPSNHLAKYRCRYVCRAHSHTSPPR